MAKAGVGPLTRSLARELAEDRINVNNVAPGLIQMTMTQDMLDDPKQAETAMQAIPWHRARQPEEIARVVLFLCSRQASFITGANLRIDGGSVTTV